MYHIQGASVALAVCVKPSRAETKTGWHFLWRIFEENGRNFLISALCFDTLLQEFCKILDGIHLGNELNNLLHYIKDYMNFIQNYRQQYTSNFLAFCEGERE